MKAKVITSLLALAMLLSIVFSGCAGPASTTSTKVKITDMEERVVEVPENVDKIVCAGPGALRIISYLDATDRVIGVEDFEKRNEPIGRPYAMVYGEEFESLPSVGEGGPGKLPNAEALIEFSPDVVFMTYVESEIADSIQSKTNIPVVILSYGGAAGTVTLEPFCRSLELAGKILGKENRASELISFLNNTQEDLKSRTNDIPEEEEPTAYYGGVGSGGAHGIDSTEANFLPFVLVNARSVVDELGEKEHVVIDKEKLLDWDPDVIFIDEGGFVLIKQDYDKNPGFYQALKAFKNGSVYGSVPFNFYASNVGTALADTYYIGKVLYPDRFTDIDATKKADDIYKVLLGKPLYSEIENGYGGYGKVDLEKGKVGGVIPTATLPIKP